MRSVEDRFRSYSTQLAQNGNLFFFLRDYFLLVNHTRQRAASAVDILSLLTDPVGQLTAAFLELDTLSTQAVKRNSDIIIHIGGVSPGVHNEERTPSKMRRSDSEVDAVVRRGLGRFWQGQERLRPAPLPDPDDFALPVKNLRFLLVVSLLRRGFHLASVRLLLLLGRPG